jgi:hypothetical protein
LLDFQIFNLTLKSIESNFSLRKIEKGLGYGRWYPGPFMREKERLSEEIRPVETKMHNSKSLRWKGGFKE